MRFGIKKTARQRLSQNPAPRQALNYYRSKPKPVQPAKSPFQKQSPRLAKRRRFVSRLVDFLLLGLIAFGLVHSLIIKPSPKIILNDQTYRAESDYRQALIKELRSPRNRTKLSLDQKAIATHLKRQFAEITSLSVGLALFSQIPTIKINVDPPSFNLSSSSESYVINARGVAVAKTGQLAAANKLPTVIDQSNFKPSLGKQILGSDEVSFINFIIGQCNRAKVPIQSISLPIMAQEIDLRTSDRSYFIKFFLGSDAAQQAGQFLAARHQFDSSGNQPAEYLDVRVAGKIYYK